ncbi:MAG: hypothetical protein WCR54_07760 [Clostridia bacterium]
MANLFEEFTGASTIQKTTLGPQKKASTKNKKSTSPKKDVMHPELIKKQRIVSSNEDEKPYNIQEETTDGFQFNSEIIANELSNTTNLAKYVVMSEILNKPKFRR